MGRTGHLLRRHGFDVLVVIAAIGGAAEVVLTHDAPEAPRVTVWFAVPAIVVLVLPLLGHRRFPFAAPASLWLLAAGISFADGRLVVFADAAYVAGTAAAFLLGNLPDDVQARIGLVITVGSVAVIVYNDPDHATGNFIFTPLLFAIAWLAGLALRERSAQAEAAELRALHAEREREAAARVAVAEERARIARELHDIVAHSVSVMVLQVGAVRHQLPAMLAEEGKALRGVEQTGRSALAEMRRLLGAMRHDDEDLELAPQPGLDGLEGLVQRIRRAGLPVRVRVDGDAVPLPPAIDLSAYRIVQEGLTNALKHARASQAEVIVRYGRDELDVEVRDDGSGGGGSDGLGHGLVGIRERVKIYGGEMSAGTVNGGGFRLRTRLPLGGHRS